MPDPDVERAAEFLAAHAVLLLGIGVLAALASLLAIVFAVRAVAHFRRPLRQLFSTLVGQAEDVGLLTR